MKDTSTDFILVPSDVEKAADTLPNYAVVPHDLEQALDVHVATPGASQRVLLPDIYYLWGPSRLLSNQILGWSGCVVGLTIIFSSITWNFVNLTLQLFVGLLAGDPPRL